MAKQKWCVRVIVHNLERYEAGEELPPHVQQQMSTHATVIESLRYAGIIKVRRGGFDLRAPAGITDTRQWATMNAERMSTFGWCIAAAAPEEA